MKKTAVVFVETMWRAVIFVLALLGLAVFSGVAARVIVVAFRLGWEGVP